MCDECADLKRRLAEAERERDEARAEIAYAVEHGVPGLVATAKEGIDKTAALYATALAASQAREARLRDYMNGVRADLQWARDRGMLPTCLGATLLNAVHAYALASAPGSTDALREVCERVGEKAWVAGVEAYKAPPPEGITDRDGFNDYVLSSIKSIVSRILGERAKEGGDA